MSNTLFWPATSRGQVPVPSIGTPPIGAPLADPLAELEKAAERAALWAEAACIQGGAAALGFGARPAFGERRAAPKGSQG